MGGSAFVDTTEYKEFDNFNTDFTFYLNNKLWNSSEHAYQALKFADEKYIEKIRNTKDIIQVYILGREKKWDESLLIDANKLLSIDITYNIYENEIVNIINTVEKINLMYKANYEKIFQNDCLVKLLKSIPLEKEIKFFGSSRFWNKWNAFILEYIRRII